MKNNCVKCWDKFTPTRSRTLRCDKCIKLVDEEFKWEISRPFEFYFRFYKKQNEKFWTSTGIWKIPVREM